MSRITSARFMYLWVIPNLIFAVIAYLTDAANLIAVFNSALLALAIGVCFAYSPVVHEILFSQRPLERSDWLGLGIFCSWSGAILFRAYSLVFRWMDRPDWLADSDVVSYGLYLYMCAAIFHLLAPNVIGNHIPPDKWVKVGMIVAASVFFALMALFVFGTKVKFGV